MRGCRQTTKKTCRSNAASGAKFRRIPAKTPGSNWVAILIPVPQRETGLTGTPYAATALVNPLITWRYYVCNLVIQV